MTELLYKELSYRIIGAAMEVHRQLGAGFLESVYHNALAHELTLQGIPFESKRPLPVNYKGHPVGVYEADVIVDNSVILELKSMRALSSANVAQAHHYLAATGLRLAILINFGAPSLETKRVAR